MNGDAPGSGICNICGYVSGDHPNGSRLLRVCPSCKAYPRQRSFKQVFTRILEPEIFADGSWRDALLLSPGTVERSLLEARFAKCVLSSLYQSYPGKFVRADVRDLAPFRDASFDFVQACNVIDYIPEMERAIAAVHRVLRPQGVFCFLILEHSLLDGDAAISVTTRKAPTGNYWPDKNAVPDVSIGRQRLARILADTGFSARELRLTEPLSASPNSWWLCRRA